MNGGALRKLAVLFPWVDGRLAPKGPATLESTFSSERALGHGGKKAEVEKLWRELFSDPSEWRDHSSDKVNPRFPDFMHKKYANKSLWLDSKWVPLWVEEKLAALPPGSIQLSTFSKNQRLSRYVQTGQYEKTIELFQQMQRDDNADRFTFIPVLKACANLGLVEQGGRFHRRDVFAALEVGRHAHEEIIRRDYDSDVVVGTCLVDMYAKCGSIEEAERVFNQMPSRDVVTLNAMIGGYVKCGQGQKALLLFEQMQGQGVDPNPVTFIQVLNACASVAALEVGRRVHKEIIRRGYESNVVVGNCLVDMYAKCASIEDAERVFIQMPTRDVVTLTAMIVGYVKCGEGQKALELVEQMQGQGLDPDPVTFVGILNACASVTALDVGRRTHEEIIRRGYESEVVVGTSLVDMYAKCGSIEESEKVFHRMPTRDVATSTAIIGGYVKCGEGQKALEVFEQMQSQGLDPNPVTFVGVLNACASVSALEVGRRVHKEIIRKGYESHAILGNCLVDMYGKCGSIEEAERVFNLMPSRDIFTLTAMIGGYVKCGEGQKALQLFEQMQGQGVDPDPVTFVGVLNACANVAALEVGRRAHEEIICRGYESDIVVGNCLLDMYGKCGSMEDAERLFKQMPTKNVVTLNAMIGGYVKCGEGQKALELFQQMQRQGLDPNLVTYVGVLNACASTGDLDKGRLTHQEIIHRGYESDIVVGNCLVDMYAKCGSIAEAEIVFNKMPTRDVVTFTTMISGYVKYEEEQKALELFEQMQGQGLNPGPATFVRVLNSCANGAALEVGRKAHEEITLRGYESDVVVGNCLVDMYAKCGRLEEAERVFNQMPTRDVITLTAMIVGYVKCGEGQKALELFKQMQGQGLEPNTVTFVGLLNACASVGVAALEVGRRAHEEIIRRGYESEIIVGNCLVDMYGKCGSIEEAEGVFNQIPRIDVVTLTAMIGGYVKCGEGQKALDLFEQVQELGVDPNSVTFIGVLNACASIAALEVGKHAHEEIIRRGYELDVVMGNCLVDMYAKCGSVEEAEKLFLKMPTKNVITWNAMIGGYAKCGDGQKALELFRQMQGQGVVPDAITFVEVLNACASVAALEVGCRAHEEIICRGYESDVVVGNCLIDMYAKCGSLGEAERVFKHMPTRDVVTWTSMLAGYGIHGNARRALETFKEMCEVAEIDGVSFVSLLSACSHEGLVAEGLEYFESMSAVHNITPTLEHFACVVDLLGRAGRLNEAKDLIMSMPMDPNGTVWMALLGACRAHVNVEVGEHCAKQVLELEHDNSAAYVLLSNIYVAAGKFDSSARLRGERMYRGVKKTPGRTWIEVNSKVHSFTADDDKHPQIVKVHAELNRLSRNMMYFGYVSDTGFVLDNNCLQCVNEEENEFHLCHHSEKLAIALGLISTAPGTPLQIIKNLQMCSYCHATTKFVSKMVGRAITVRDATQFHQFQDGLCSCRDNW